MAQPTADIPRVWKAKTRLNNLVAAGTIYYGVACSDASGGGTINQLVDGEAFVGFSLEQVASGDNCQLVTEGEVLLTVTGVDAATDYGVPVYATEGSTFSLTDSGSDTQIGTVLRVEDATNNIACVAFQAAALRSV